MKSKLRIYHENEKEVSQRIFVLQQKHKVANNITYRPLKPAS
jgi:hypothetical protein